MNETGRMAAGTERLNGGRGTLLSGAAKGGGIALVGHALGNLLNFAHQVLLARVLGPQPYGLYSLGYGIFGVFRILSGLGLHNGVMKYGSIHSSSCSKAELKGILISALLLAAGLGILIGSSLFLASDLISIALFKKEGLAPVLRGFGLALPFYGVMFVAAFSARVFHRMSFDVLARQLMQPITAILAAGLSFLFGFRLWGAVGGFVASSVASAGVGLFLLARLFPDLFRRTRVSYDVWTLLRYSSVVALTGLSHLLVSRVDRLMIGGFRPSAEVGIYNAAALVASQIVVVKSSFAAAFAPRAAALFHQGDQGGLSLLFETTTRWILTLSLPLFLAAAFFPQGIMGLFGAEYRAGWVILLCLAIAWLFNAATGPAGYVLTMTGYHAVELANGLSLGVMNLGLNWILIPKFGAIGAAIATGTAITLINAVRIIEVYRFHHLLPYSGRFLKPLVAALITAGGTAGFCRLLQPRGAMWIAGVGFVGVTYFGVLVLLGIEDEDRRLLGRLYRLVLRSTGRRKTD